MSTCNCGRRGRYISNSGSEEPTLSCNKYKACPPYDELQDEAAHYKNVSLELFNIATDLSVYREGTEHYQQALYRLSSIGNKEYKK